MRRGIAGLIVAWGTAGALAAGAMVAESATPSPPLRGGAEGAGLVVPAKYSTILPNGGPIEGVAIRGEARIVEHKGRRGLHATSTRTLLALEGFQHTLNRDQGALTVWVMPVDDLANTIWWGHFADLEPDFGMHTILSDHTALRDVRQARFALFYRRWWWRPLMAKFARTPFDPPGADVKPGHEHMASPHSTLAHLGPDDFVLHRESWYQIGLSWNRRGAPPHGDGSYRMYVNGVLVAHGTPWLAQRSEPAGDVLYAGNPALVIGEVSAYDRTLPAEAFQAIYAREATAIDGDVMDELRRVHAGEGVEPFRWSPGPPWRLELDLPLTREADLEHFYVQGCREAVRVTPDGLLVETPLNAETNLPNAPGRETQVYLHTLKFFEGDLALELDFKYRGRTGLALLMLQAAGMQGEDFMRDYPLRTTGKMNMVHKENVRNYHWEFFRHMDGNRSDVACHILMKNPFLYGLAYRAMKQRLAEDEWHHLQFVQEGDRLRGAVDGELIFDVTDDPFSHHGPAYHRGHVSLRNMFKTRFLWRNLKVYAAPPPYRTEAAAPATRPADR